MTGCVTWRVFNSNYFATPVASAEVWALLSAILIITDQWQHEGFCRPWQRSVVPPLQPATPILSGLNKEKNKHIKHKKHIAMQTPKLPIFSPQMPPPTPLQSAAIPRPLPAATVTDISAVMRACVSGYILGGHSR